MPRPGNSPRVKIERIYAGMMELADMRDLGSRAERRAGSTPVTRTYNAECGIRNAE